MSKQHTPGPWKAQLYEGSRFDGLPYAQWEIFADDQPGTYVASANEDNDDAEANARLIAAAPDLLWALRNLSAIVDAAILSGDWKVDGACDPDMDIAAARAAIAKARGDA